VAVIDCLEFNRDFRVVDAVDDLAFLAMECERLQAPLVGEILFATYREVTGDDPPREVILFYKAARACLRAKLAIWHTRDPAVPNHWAWVDLAVGYLRMALSYAAALPG
jgi:aminoglycoside phosphotransferase family enzyme